jgi:antitoxin Phd
VSCPQPLSTWIPAKAGIQVRQRVMDPGSSLRYGRDDDCADFLRTRLVVPLMLNPKMGTWQVQEAKTRLSEVIERARTEGPQMITRRGAERAVVISIEAYRALVAHKPDFKAHLFGGPKVDDFTIERDRDTGRPVEL